MTPRTGRDPVRRELPVAVDAMGGDHAPHAIVAGALAAARGGVPVVLVGDEARIRPLVPLGAPIRIEHAADAIAMDEPPSAVRRRPDASVRRAARLVAEGHAGALVSCGNSGAVLAAGLLDVGLLDGVERPPIATVLPRRDGGRLILVDSGAMVDCRSEQLASFALLGTAYARVLGVEDPRVALLSNGEEASKGNDQVRAARPVIEALPVRFVGNIEPSGALAGGCDVAVCDGFVGNVMIKAVEGAAETVFHLLREEIGRNPSALLGAWLVSGAIRRFRQRVAWEAQGGGLLLGARGVVVIGHGRANAEAVQSSIEQGHRAWREHLVERVAEQLTHRAAGR